MSDFIRRVETAEALKANAPVAFPLRQASISASSVIPGHVKAELLDHFVFEDVEAEHEQEPDQAYSGPRWCLQELLLQSSSIWIGSRGSGNSISALFPGSALWVRVNNHYVWPCLRVSLDPRWKPNQEELWVIAREDRVWVRKSSEEEAEEMRVVQVTRYVVGESAKGESV